MKITTLISISDVKCFTGLFNDDGSCNTNVTPKPKCLNPNEDGSCDDNECFCPCDCDKNQVAFKTLPGDDVISLETDTDYPDISGSFEGSGSSLEGSGSSVGKSLGVQDAFEKAKSIDIKVAQTNDILNQIDLINKGLFDIDIRGTSSPKKQRKVEDNADKCYCHCKCCNKNEDVGEKVPENKQLFKNTR